MASSESGEAQGDAVASGDSGDRHSPVVLWMDVTDGCTTQDAANTATCRAPAPAAQVEMANFAATQTDGSAAAAQMTPSPVDINHVACQLALARAQLVKAASTRVVEKNKCIFCEPAARLLPQQHSISPKHRHRSTCSLSPKSTRCEWCGSLSVSPLHIRAHSAIQHTRAAIAHAFAATARCHCIRPAGASCLQLHARIAVRH